MSFPMQLVFVLCADSAEVGRFDASSLSDETLLELLVGGFRNNKIFYDDDGEFKDISDLRGVFMTPEGEISLFDYGGKRFGGTLHFQYFPRHLEKIRLYGNKLLGEFIAKLVPIPAYVVFIGNNSLTGSLVVSDLSDNLESISLFKNSLSGTLSFERMPASLREFAVKDNCFSGSLNFSFIERPISYDHEDLMADAVWEREEVEGDFVYFDFRGNQDIKGDVLVKSLFSCDDLVMFEDTGVTGIVDGNGKRIEAGQY